MEACKAKNWRGCELSLFSRYRHTILPALLNYSLQEKGFQENRIHGLMKIPALHHEITQQMTMVYQSLGNQMLDFAFTLPYPIHR